MPPVADAVNRSVLLELSREACSSCSFSAYIVPSAGVSVLAGGDAWPPPVPPVADAVNRSVLLEFVILSLIASSTLSSLNLRQSAAASSTALIASSVAISSSRILTNIAEILAGFNVKVITFGMKSNLLFNPEDTAPITVLEKPLVVKVCLVRSIFASLSIPFTSIKNCLSTSSVYLIHRVASFERLSRTTTASFFLNSFPYKLTLLSSSKNCKCPTTNSFSNASSTFFLNDVACIDKQPFLSL